MGNLNISARDHLDLPQEEWNAIIWIDEKAFSSTKDEQYRVWRPDGKRLNPKYVLPSGYNGRITIRFWRNMYVRGLLELTEI